MNDAEKSAHVTSFQLVKSLPTGSTIFCLLREVSADILVLSLLTGSGVGATGSGVGSGVGVTGAGVSAT